MRKKIIIGSIVLLLIIVYAILVVRVNVVDNYNVKYQYRDVGESELYNGCSIKVTKSGFLSEEDFRNEYKIDENTYSSYYEGNKKYLIVETECTKLEDSTEEAIPWYNLMFVNDIWADIVDMDLFYVLNGEKSYGDLAKGEKIKVIYPVVLKEDFFSKRGWKNLETTPMYLQMLDYDGHEYYTMMRIF